MEKFINHRFFLVGFTFLTFSSGNGFEVEKSGLFMPNVHPNLPEMLLCSPMRINFNKEYYIVGFEPKASMDKIHHMVLYGCTKPGSNKPLWSCDDDANSVIKDDDLDNTPPCESGAQFLYAWARNATTLQLPPEVGFKVGGNSSIQYLVLQLHYSSNNHSSVDSSEHSGLVLHVTQQPMRKLAGQFAMGAGGEVHPHSTARWESACEIKENKTFHPFAFRVHTHRLGTVVRGYLVKTDDKGKHHWTLIGKKDPQKPHMFYPVNNNVSVSNGDTVAARCSYRSNRNNITVAGGNNDDEMCLFYMMYYVDEGAPLNMRYCFTKGPPSYYWDSELNNIPADASTPE
ncbi:peptidylglycine alpha-hydroxylating monooxygenase-like [Macrosteles quadrilineatus]|uniref:peptidylglycine alpha-hydroxylating monooxygenase-like n=1 Tax=Macrosteles quadrilineatus TaxID=74068 RepID=UPI0023E0EB88|nr:peptidylglycine alpha-hydroxylating monooxygenase-like [Macrosteles quadrilineatus]